MDELTKAIDTKIKENYRSVREFANTVNLPYTTIKTALEKGFGGTAVEKVIKICAALGININDFTGCNGMVDYVYQYIRFLVKVKLNQHFIAIKRSNLYKNTASLTITPKKR